jgi:hypothetical protein
MPQRAYVTHRCVQNKTARAPVGGWGRLPPQLEARAVVFAHTGNPSPIIAYLRLVTHFMFFNCGSGPEHGHETALELVSGVNFGCVLHHFPARPVGTSLWAKFGWKLAKQQNMFLSFVITYSKPR